MNKKECKKRRSLGVTILFVVLIFLGSCSSHRPKVGDWYELRQEKRKQIQIKFLGTGKDISDKAKGRRYRSVSGAREYAVEECFAYEDSQQVLWEKVYFLAIEPLSNLKAKYTEMKNHPESEGTK